MMSGLKINETRKRSLLKAISFRIVEIAVDTWVLSCFVDVAIAVGLSVLLEFICLVLHYGFERAWNRFDYGREIK